MDDEVAQKVFAELIPYMEELESQNTAMLNFLQEKGIAPREEFAVYLDGASKSSSVRWSAVRARVAYLLTPRADAQKGTRHDSAHEEEKGKNKQQAPGQNGDKEQATSPSTESERQPSEHPTTERQTSERQTNHATEKQAAAEDTKDSAVATKSEDTISNPEPEPLPQKASRKGTGDAADLNP